MKLNGIFRAPADAKGIKQGDIVVEFGPAKFQDDYTDENGKKVKGAYDYTRYTLPMLEARIAEKENGTGKVSAKELSLEIEARTQLKSVTEAMNLGALKADVFPVGTQPKNPVKDIVPGFVQDILINEAKRRFRYDTSAEFVKTTANKVMDVFPMDDKKKTAANDFINSTLDLDKTVKDNLNPALEKILTPVVKTVQNTLDENSTEILKEKLTAGAANLVSSFLSKKKTP